ncbi:sel1 repeat family protein, partial [Xanthomonas perforans]|nr:sel1 repeat family protein [Xanthomonas perforans]
ARHPRLRALLHEVAARQRQLQPRVSDVMA